MGVRPDILDLVDDMRAKGEPFVLATVVRTVAATAAKAGAKAVIDANGSISAGWIGGGCARAAVLYAAKQALADGKPHLVSIQPKDRLDECGVDAGEEREGVEFARNSCPSQGTMDIFVEPILPRPNLVICGASPVAVALADLARRMGFFVTICAPAADHASFGETDRCVDGFVLPDEASGPLYVVVATQGRGDLAALERAVASPAGYVAFVGSRKKAGFLSAGLVERGADPARVASIVAPAGLDIGAITSEEIALSVLAEMIVHRRRGSRQRI